MTGPAGLDRELNSRLYLGWLPSQSTDVVMARTYDPALVDLLYLYAAYPGECSPPPLDATRIDPIPPDVHAVFHTAHDRDAYVREVGGDPALYNPSEREEHYDQWLCRHVIADSEEDWHRLLTCATLKIKYNNVQVVRILPFQHYNIALRNLMQNYKTGLDKDTAIK